MELGAFSVSLSVKDIAVFLVTSAVLCNANSEGAVLHVIESRS